jgi:hypothetical protein
MPFGYVNSPSVYQRGIDKAVGELKGKQALIYNYIDDVIIPFKTEEEGFQHLEKVLRALFSVSFRLNYQKCTFITTETLVQLSVLEQCVVVLGRSLHSPKMLLPRV